MSLLAIDFGGTRIRAAWYDTALKQQARAETPTRVEDGQAAVLARLIEAARQVVPHGEVPSAIGVAAPGPLDVTRGVILHAKTLPDWEDVPLAQIISEAFGGVRTVVQNDANLGALAEYALGAGRGANPMIYMTISTGIGGGAIVDGKLFGGWSGLAIEPGHILVWDDCDKCYTRLEALASGTGLAAQAERGLASDAQALSSLRSVDAITGAAVAAAARTGDAFACSIVEAAGVQLGAALVNVMHLLSPQAIVVGGSVAQLGDLLFAPMWRTIHALVLDEAFLPPDLIRMAQFGDDVCLLGAALYAKESSS
jgi:glucokinase